MNNELPKSDTLYCGSCNRYGDPDGTGVSAFFHKDKPGVILARCHRCEGSAWRVDPDGNRYEGEQSTQQFTPLESWAKDKGIPIEGIERAPVERRNTDRTARNGDSFRTMDLYFEYPSGIHHVKNGKYQSWEPQGARKGDDSLWMWQNTDIQNPDPGTAYICEGESDATGAGQYGFLAFGIPGALQFSEDKAIWLSNYLATHHPGVMRIRICLDADPAGESGAKKAIGSLSDSHAFIIEKLVWPEDTDPKTDICDLIKSHGKTFPRVFLSHEWVNPFTQAAQVPVYVDPHKPEVIAEYDFEHAVSALTVSSGKPSREDVYRRLLTLDDDVTADHLLESIAKQVGVKRSIITKEWKVVKSQGDKIAKREQARESEGIADDLCNEVAKLVVMPKNAEDDPEPMDGSFVIQEQRDGGKYLYPFWNDSRTATADVSRTLYQKAREIGADNIDIAEQYLGNNPLIREARTRLELRVQMADGIKHVVCSPGPFYDSKTGEYHVKSDIDKGVIIFRGSDAMRGARIVEKGPLIEERPEALEKFKRVCGSNWEPLLAHCIASLVRHDDAKHALIISAPRNSGKSTLARFINHLVDGKENMVNSSELKGLWPKIFSSINFILDNMDDPKSFLGDDMTTLIGGTTAGYTTVPARFTRSGLTGRMGFPIFTTILSNPFQYIETLADRSIMINHEFQEGLRDFGTDELKALAEEFRPHLLYMVKQYVAELPDLPKAPGGIRQKCFASAAYWLRLQHEDGYTEGECHEYVKSFKYEPDTEEESDSFMSALDSFIKSSDSVADLTATECATGMIHHARDHCENIRAGKERTPLTEHPQPGRVFKQRFEKAAAGDRIGDWRFVKRKETSGDNKNKWLYTFYRDTS